MNKSLSLSLSLSFSLSLFLSFSLSFILSIYLSIYLSKQVYLRQILWERKMYIYIYIYGLLAWHGIFTVSQDKSEYN